MKVEYNEKFNFNHIIAEDGMVITDYVDGMDILEYSSSKEMYCPASVDLTKYYEITDAEDLEYRKLQEEAFEKVKEDRE